VRSNDEIQDLADAFNAMADNLVQTIERLREANRELEQLDQAKADLVANVSHELKTPLTALRGYLELMEQGDLGELSSKAAQAVEVCQKNVKRLALRIEELVQLSDLEKSFAGEPLVETVHLGKLLHGAVETLLPKLEDQGVLCSLNLATDLPTVLANAEQLERVFLNLLDNSRKFTSAGGFIRVSAEPYDRNGSEGVVVRVADTGVGIPSSEMLRIFDRFYQVDPSARRRHGGMGLGLSLVRSIVEAHRGSVWVESKEGRGSTFFVWLPRNPVSSSGEFPAVRQPSSGDNMEAVLPQGEETEENA
jgi:signal transduction histidine kinase